MVFEPISGTVGGVALVDPVLRGFSWTYGKYKLLKQFSDHYTSETIKYRSEVARFGYIRDLKIDAFETRLLNESETFFLDTFRDRLILAMEALEECEKLVQKHDPSFLEGKLGDPDHGNTDPGSAQSGLSPGKEGENATPSPVSVTDSTTSPQSAVRGTNTEPSSAGITLSTTTSGFGRSQAKSSSLRSLLSFRKGKNKLSQSATPSAAARQLDLASTDLKETQKALEQSRIQFRKESGLVERLKWVAEERSRFIYLNKEIRRHNDYFLSLVGHRAGQKSRGASLTPKNEAISARTRNIASHLKRLIQSLGATKHSNRVSFQMMLLESPFKLRSRMGDALPFEALLRPSSSMFPFKVVETVAQANNKSVAPVKAKTSVIFEVPSPKQTNEDLMQQVKARHKIESFAESFPPISDPNHESNYDNTWWSAIGNINDITISAQADNSNEPISVFLDRGFYIEAKSLLASFNDPAFSKLATNTHLIYRLHLAYILASSFTYFLLADCPLDYISESLVYYSEEISDKPNTQHLAETRLAPYIALRPIGAPNSTPKSFSSIISSTVDLVSKDQMLLHRLGVLLCEVGSWKPIVVGEATVAERNLGSHHLHDWQGLASEARILAVNLVRCATSGYQRVVNACLDFTPQEGETIQAVGEWLEENVVVPLSRELDGLGPEFRTT